jgi:cell division initiation protein
MGITTDDILQKQFLKRFFRSGYDMDEVDAFLDEVAERVHELSEENSALQKQVSDLKERNARHEEQEATFKNALLSAQKVADDLIAQSKQEADGLLSEAREKVARAQNEAEKEINKLQEQVDALHNLRDTMRRELNEALESFQLTLDNISKSSPGYHFLDTPAAEEPVEFETSSQEDESGLFEKIDLDEQEIDTFEGLTFEAEEPVLDQEEDQQEKHGPAVFNGMDDEEEEDSGPELY